MNIQEAVIHGLQRQRERKFGTDLSLYLRESRHRADGHGLVQMIVNRKWVLRGNGGLSQKPSSFLSVIGNNDAGACPPDRDQTLHEDALAVNPVVTGRSFNHRVLARHLVCRQRKIKAIARRRDYIQIRQGRLHHDHVGAFLARLVQSRAWLRENSRRPSDMTAGRRTAAPNQPPRGTARSSPRQTSRHKKGWEYSPARPRPKPCGSRQPGRPSYPRGR